MTIITFFKKLRLNNAGEINMKKVSKNVYAETNFDGCNPGFVVTSDGVVMVDTPQKPTDAIKWREIIKKYGRIRYLINTEPHGDHFTGNYFYKGTVIAHEGTRQAILSSSVQQLKDRLKKTSPADYALLKNFKFRPPTITFNKEMTFYLGNHTFRLINLPGHTPYQVAVFIPEEKVIFTSDNIFYKVTTWLQQAVPYEWIDSLKKMAELDAEVLIPGHGEVCDLTYIPEMCERIQEWIDAVDDVVQRGLTLEEAQEKFTFHDRYSWQAGSETMTPFIHKMNLTHLYEVLKNRQ
jgi:glyoxylase-like metal-dependent hydrolase (beta-lactamase superfamily II)